MNQTIDTQKTDQLQETENRKQTSVLSRTGVAVFYGILIFFLAATLLLPSQAVSFRERRRLSQFPAWNWKEVWSGRWEEKTESALQDQIFGRNDLLNLQAFIQLAASGGKKSGDLVIEDSVAITLPSAINEASLQHAAAVFDFLYENCLKDSDCSLYFSIVPDKAYYLENQQILDMDYDAFFEMAWDLLEPVEKIDLRSVLSIEDYYASDPHWKQENLLGAASVLAQAMHITLDPSLFEQQSALSSFSGQQGQLSGSAEIADALNYLVAEQMKDWTVTQHGGSAPVDLALYDFDALEGMDPYAFFLSGNPGMAVIENPHGQKGRELVVFRDSYGSAIVPILASAYEKTTVIDLRAMPSARIPNLVDFTNQDVLFLYSTSVLNASDALK